MLSETEIKLDHPSNQTWMKRDVERRRHPQKLGTEQTHGKPQLKLNPNIEKQLSDGSNSS